MKLVIDRSKWRTGSSGRSRTGKGDTELLNKEGYMCCLGFFGKLCGYTDDDLIAHATPTNTIYESDNPNRWPSWFLKVENGYVSYDIAEQFMDINDDIHISRREREARIRRKFAEHNVEVVFVGKYET